MTPGRSKEDCNEKALLPSQMTFAIADCNLSIVKLCEQTMNDL